MFEVFIRNTLKDFKKNMMEENVMIESWKLKDRLIRALEHDIVKFNDIVKTAMEQQIVLYHISAMKIRLCDHADIHVDDTLSYLLKNGSHPFHGNMMVFGVTEEWLNASSLPNRQLIFLVSSCKHILAYEDEMLFYIAPTFEDLWTVKLTLTEENVVSLKRKSYLRTLNYFKSYFEKMKRSVIAVNGAMPTKLDLNDVSILPLGLKYTVERLPTLPGVKISISRQTQTDSVNMDNGFKTFTLSFAKQFFDNVDTQCSGVKRVRFETTNARSFSVGPRYVEMYSYSPIKEDDEAGILDGPSTKTMIIIQTEVTNDANKDNDLSIKTASDIEHGICCTDSAEYLQKDLKNNNENWKQYLNLNAALTDANGYVCLI